MLSAVWYRYVTSFGIPLAASWEGSAQHPSPLKIEAVERPCSLLSIRKKGEKTGPAGEAPVNPMNPGRPRKHGGKNFWGFWSTLTISEANHITKKEGKGMFFYPLEKSKTWL